MTIESTIIHHVINVNNQLCGHSLRSSFLVVALPLLLCGIPISVFAALLGYFLYSALAINWINSSDGTTKSFWRSFGISFAMVYLCCILVVMCYKYLFCSKVLTFTRTYEDVDEIESAFKNIKTAVEGMIRSSIGTFLSK